MRERTRRACGNSLFFYVTKKRKSHVLLVYTCIWGFKFSVFHRPHTHTHTPLQLHDLRRSGWKKETDSPNP